MTKSPPGRKKTYVPEQGDVIWLDFDPQAGHEQAGRRPALVISPAGYNGKVGMAIVCPVTTQAKGYPYEVLIPAGFKASGVILSDQLKKFDWRARNAARIDSLPENLVREVLEKATTLLDPSEER